MSRQNIANLLKPRKRYSIERHFKRFETKANCRRDDRIRADAIDKAISPNLPNPAELKRAERLLQRLRGPIFPGRLPEFTVSSRVSMRDWRNRIGGQLWELLDPLNPSEWVFFTIILPGWWVASDRLEEVNPRNIIKEVRNDLNQARRRLKAAGIEVPKGWLFAMIDGQFDGSTEGFQLHLHGLATKSMIAVLKALRKAPKLPGKRRRWRKVRGLVKYRADKRDRERYPMACLPKGKLQIEEPHKKLRSITYPSKSYWTARNSVLGKDGKRKRVGKKHAIPGEHQVRHLLWLDRYSLKDLTLLVGLRVIKGRLTPAIAGKSGATGSL